MILSKAPPLLSAFSGAGPWWSRGARANLGESRSLNGHPDSRSNGSDAPSELLPNCDRLSGVKMSCDALDASTAAQRLAGLHPACCAGRRGWLSVASARMRPQAAAALCACIERAAQRRHCPYAAARWCTLPDVSYPLHSAVLLPLSRRLPCMGVPPTCYAYMALRRRGGGPYRLCG